MTRSPHVREDGRTLGSHLRASRLGWRWHETLAWYLRISDNPAGPGWLIDLATPAGIATQPRPTPIEHRVWWNDPVLVGMLADVVDAVLTDDERSSRPNLLRLTVTDDGTRTA